MLLVSVFVLTNTVSTDGSVAGFTAPVCTGERTRQRVKEFCQRSEAAANGVNDLMTGEETQEKEMMRTRIRIQQSESAPQGRRASRKVTARNRRSVEVSPANFSCHRRARQTKLCRTKQLMIALITLRIRRSCNVISARGPYVRLATIGFADSPSVRLYRSRRRDAALPAIALARRERDPPQDSPFVATLLSCFVPGLGAAYNGQTSKALVHFAILPAFPDGGGYDGVTFFFSRSRHLAVRGRRCLPHRQLMRAGLAPTPKKTRSRANYTETDRLGVILVALGLLFLSHTLLAIQFPVRKMLPVALVALGAYILFDI